jgi:hypothetical protein
LISSLLLGDLTGFAALAFTGLSASLMILRARLIRVLGGPNPVRTVHVAISVLAVGFIAAHVSLLFLPPITFAVDLGYASVILGVALWATGVGFLERNRDSFFMHGSLALALVAAVIVHAASSGTNFPVYVALVALVGAASIALTNAGYHLRKMLAKPK